VDVGDVDPGLLEDRAVLQHAGDAAPAARPLPRIGGEARRAVEPLERSADLGLERGERPEALYKTYAQVRSKGTHIEAKPGDLIPVAGLTVQVLTAGGGLLSVPVEGGGIPNPLCATFKPMKDETSDDAHSVGTLVTHGKFRLVNLGDLSWNQEYGLVCPTNRIGPVDVLLAQVLIEGIVLEHA
jgi:hypothetical protein